MKGEEPEPEENEDEKDIIIEFDLEKVDQQYINSFLIHLQQIIDETEEIGEFEYGPFKFKINNKIDRSDLKKIITNPKVKKRTFIYNSLMDKEIEKIAEEISFRLLATKDHPDYEWLKEQLKKLWKNTSTEEK